MGFGEGRVGRFAATGLAAAAIITASTAVGQGTSYHGRRAWTLRNNRMTVVVTPGGGHIASMTLNSGRGAGLNPFWLPPWQSVEPGVWQRNPAAYGGKPAAQLLSTILGHNICVDFFGAPSAPEAAAGMPVHGEAPTVNWRAESRSRRQLTYSTRLPLARMNVSRTIRLTPGSSAIWITESIENQAALDRPIGWQQHPSFGPPFLEAGATFFDMNGRESVVYPKEFSTGERLQRGARFQWPNAPAKGGGTVNIREYPKGGKNSDFTATLIEAGERWGWVTAVNVRRGLLAGYVWPRADWPWVGNWEENHFRAGLPWKGRAVVRGMEFGTTPFPDSRRDAVTMGTLFRTPTYRWISAKAKQTIGYGAFVAPIPAGTTGVRDVEVVGNSVQITLTGVSRTINLPVTR